MKPETGGVRNYLAQHKWLKRLSITGVSFLVLLGLLSGGLWAYATYVNHQLHRVVVKGLSPQATKGPNVGIQTFLLIGSTSRCVLNGKQTAAFGSCAAGVTGVNSDVVLLLRVDSTTHTVAILSLPRDLVLQNVRPGQFHKIDAALANGPSQLVSVVQQDFNIPINHFVELNFDSFQNVVNALGGVKMYFPTPEKDDYSSLNITTAGCHLLNGFQALAVVRARHLQYGSHLQFYDGSGDLGRIIRDHEFLRVLAASVAKRGLGNPITDNSIIEAVAPKLTIDAGLSLHDMVDIVLAFHGVNVNKVPEWTLPNIELHTDYYFQGFDYGSVVFPSYPQDQQAVDQFLGLKQPPDSKLNPSSFTVSVVDGTNSATQASQIAARLKQIGFNVSPTIGSQTPVGPLSEAIVYYKPGHRYQGQRLLDSLHGIVSMAAGPTVGGADVTLVTGSNFYVPLPKGSSARSSGSGPAPSGSGSGSSGGSSGSSAYGSPASYLGQVSSAAQALPWYDPRAC